MPSHKADERKIIHPVQSKDILVMLIIYNVQSFKGFLFFGVRNFPESEVDYKHLRQLSTFQW